MPTIVGLGEALFDVFENGKEVVGGAPLNFAVHAHRLAQVIGKSATIASRAGADEHGAALRTFLQSAGMTADFVELDPEHPTGTVQVKVDATGHASYEIISGVAWDFLESTPEFDALADRCELVCYGTLAQRSPQSRRTIEAFLVRAKKALRLFDVNLRQSFYDYSVVRRGCALATAVKVNEEELGVLTSMLTLRGSTPGDRILSLFERFPIEVVILTRGAAGTAIYTTNGRFEDKPAFYPMMPGADSVGAGDAATAAAAIAILAGHPFDHVVKVANHAGAFVASRPGGTPVLPDEILRMLDRRAG
ncbi:MAG TPA: PfkB family carbohydrate kinase [Bryobacteraceae bacterium]|jgi:fructokinase